MYVAMAVGSTDAHTNCLRQPRRTPSSQTSRMSGPPIPCCRTPASAQKPDRNHSSSRTIAHASATMRPASVATRKIPVRATNE